MAVRHDELVYRAGGAALARYGTLRKRTAGFEEVVETWARASTAAEFDRNGVLRLAQTNAVRVSFVDLDGDDVRETLAVPMEGALTQLVEFAIPGGSESDFECRQLDGVTNLSAEYAVQIEAGDDLRYAMPANWNPNNLTISGWVIPDWSDAEGGEHYIALAYLDGSNFLTFRYASGYLICSGQAAGVVFNFNVNPAVVAGTPFFGGVRINGGRAYLYYDLDADGSLTDDVTSSAVGTFAAGSYTLRVGESNGATAQLEGAVNLLITDNGGSAAPITDRFNAGAGMALYGDDCWMARHGKNLVLHVGGNAAGTAIQAETYQAATDMLAGTATGRVDLPPTTGYVRFGNTAEFDAATKVSMMWEVEIDSTNYDMPLFMSDSAGYTSASTSLSFSLYSPTGAVGRVYAYFEGGANNLNNSLSRELVVGDRLLVGVALDLALAGTARLSTYVSFYDPLTKRYGAWQASVTKSQAGTIPATITAEAGLHQIGGSTWDGKIDTFRWKVGEAHDFTVIKPTVHEPDPSKWAHSYPFDGDANDQIGTTHGTVTGGSYVDDGRHGKGSMERWTRNGARYFDGVNDGIDLGNVKALDGATSFAMLIPFKWAGGTGTYDLLGRYDVATNNRQVHLYVDGAGASKLIAVVSVNGTAGNSGTTAAAIATDTWYMAWVLFNGAGATDADRLKIGLASLNEESGRWGAFAEQTLTIAGTIPGYLFTPSASPPSLYIGRITSGNHFKGLIDDVRLWVHNVPTVAQLNACLPTDERDWGTQSGAPYPDHWWTLSESAGGATTYDRQYLDVDCPATKIIRPTFARADTGTQVYADGVVRAAASGELRNKHSIVANDAVRYGVTLLERAYTNKMTAALASWTPAACVITSVAEADPAGGTTAALLTADAGVAEHKIGFLSTTAVGPVSGEVWLKAGTYGYARLGINNATDGNVNYAAINLATGAVVASGGLSGYTRRITVRGDGWVRVQIFGSSQVTANSYVYAYLCSSAGAASWDAAGTETIYVWRPTLYEEKVPPESVLAASETTTADSLTVPLKLTTPQEATYLYEGVALDLPNQGVNRYLYNVGSAGTDHFGVRYDTSTSRVYIDQRLGSTLVQGYWAVTLALGDYITVRVYRAANGATTASLALNGAAESALTSSPAVQALPNTWANATVAFSRYGSADTTPANSGLISFKAQSGAEKSLATMRALAQPDIAHYHPGMQIADVDGTVTGALQWYDGRIPADLTLSGVERIGRAKYLARKTFSRASVGRYYDGVDYVTRTAPAGHLRDAHYWTANDGVEYRTTLLGRAYTNLVSSDNLAGWTLVNGATVTSGISDPAGGTGAYRIEDDSALAEYITRVVGFTGDGIKGLVWAVRKASGTGTHQLQIWDSGASAERLRCRITGWTDDVPTLAVATGVLLGKRYIGNGYWAIYLQSTSVTAANTNTVYIYPSALTVAETGSIDVWKVNAYNDAVPPQDILDASEVRVADSFVDAYTALPQAATYLYEGVVADLPGQTADKWICAVGGGNTQSLLMYWRASASRLQVTFHDGATTRSLYWDAPAVTLGARISVRFQHDADGALSAGGLTINGGAEIAPSAVGAALALPASWAAPVVTFAGASTWGNSGLTKFVAASGSKTTAQMQALLETDASCLYLYVPGQYTDRGTYSMWMQNTGSTAAAQPSSTATTTGLWTLFRSRVRELVDFISLRTDVAGISSVPGQTPANALGLVTRGVRETTGGARNMKAEAQTTGFGYFDDLTWYQLPLATPSTATKGAAMPGLSGFGNAVGIANASVVDWDVEAASSPDVFDVAMGSSGYQYVTKLVTGPSGTGQRAYRLGASGQLNGLTPGSWYSAVVGVFVPASSAITASHVTLKATDTAGTTTGESASAKGVWQWLHAQRQVDAGATEAYVELCVEDSVAFGTANAYCYLAMPTVVAGRVRPVPIPNDAEGTVAKAAETNVDAYVVPSSRELTWYLKLRENGQAYATAEGLLSRIDDGATAPGLRIFGGGAQRYRVEYSDGTTTAEVALSPSVTMGQQVELRVVYTPSTGVITAGVSVASGEETTGTDTGGADPAAWSGAYVRKGPGGAWDWIDEKIALGSHSMAAMREAS